MEVWRRVSSSVGDWESLGELRVVLRLAAAWGILEPGTWGFIRYSEQGNMWWVAWTDFGQATWGKICEWELGFWTFQIWRFARGSRLTFCQNDRLCFWFQRKQFSLGKYATSLSLGMRGRDWKPGDSESWVECQQRTHSWTKDSWVKGDYAYGIE